MTSFLTLGKRAEEFADLVDTLLAPGATGPGRPDRAADPLLEVVAALRSVPVPAPSPGFTSALRQRLVDEAATVLTPAPASPFRPDRQPPRHGGSPQLPRSPRSPRSPRKVVVAATALVAVGGTAGVASAAQGALPGDALYPVKRVIEGAQLRLSTSDTGRGQDLLAQASQRLQEVGGLLESSPDRSDVAERIETTVDDFSVQGRDGSHLLLVAFREDRDRQHLLEIRSFARDSMAMLDSLAASAPAGLDDELRVAAGVMLAVDAEALGECGCEDGNPPLEVPPDFGLPSPGGGGSAEGPVGSGEGSDGVLSDGGSEPGPEAGPGLPSAATEPGPSAGVPTDVGTQPGVPDPSGGVGDGPDQGPTDGGTAAPTDGAPDAPTEPAPDAPTEAPTDAPTDTPPADPSEEPSAEPTDEPSPDATDEGNSGSGGGQVTEDPTPGGSSTDGSPGPGSGDDSGPGSGSSEDPSEDPSGGSSGSGPSGEVTLLEGILPL